VSAAVAAVMQPLFADAGRITLTPRRVLRVVRLAGFASRRVVVANVTLSRRIWAPSMPVRTGMVAVRTRVRSDAGLCAVGVVTSLIVDNQIVDVDRVRNRLLYHAIDVPDTDRAYDAINGPVDQRVAVLEAMVDA
jgi:multicomponent Na+:H+ antiporter subunit E